MNDFSELETELRKLRPAAVSDELMARIERALVEQPITSTPTSAVSRRKPVSIDWRFLGFGLAAAVALMLLAKVGNDRPVKNQETVAALTPPPARITTPARADEFIPTGMTQVVYHARDEGLVFAKGSENPVRRLRYQKRETLQWQQPATGASLRVSYPSEEIVFMPAPGQ
jgi:hypothetical protein